MTSKKIAKTQEDPGKRSSFNCIYGTLHPRMLHWGPHIALILVKSSHNLQWMAFELDAGNTVKFGAGDTGSFTVTTVIAYVR